MITVNIATHKKREQSLKVVLLSLAVQTVKVDIVNVYLNDYDLQPWMDKYMAKYPYLHFVSRPVGDLGASAKFYFVDEQKEGVYITIDDDLVPNKKYVEKMSENAYLYPNAMVGLHGTRYDSLPIKSYFHDVKRDTLYCTKKLDKDVVVDMLGTGVLAFRVTNKNIPTVKDFPQKNMTDPFLCKWSKDNNVTMVCLARPNNFVIETNNSQDTAIWKSARDNDTIQTECLNSIVKFDRKQKAESIYNYKTSLTLGAMEWEHLKIIIGLTEQHTKIVELGSGVSTDILSHYTDSLISFEHDDSFVKPASRLRGIKNGWYDLTKKDIQDIKRCDILIVDAPKANNGDRYNLPLDLLPKDAIIFVDDCHREKDMQQAEDIAKHLGKPLTIVDGINKKIGIITR